MQVQRLEIPQIVEAICELNGCDVRDCDIPITYMVISKGHHTRLFPASPRDGDRNGNVFPGECGALIRHLISGTAHELRPTAQQGCGCAECQRDIVALLTPEWYRES